MITLWLVVVAGVFSIARHAGAQLFVPEYCDWPLFPTSACVRMQFSPANPSGADYPLQWQLWSALNSPPNFNEPFISANHFRYVTTNGAVDIGLTARSQTDLMSPSSSTTSLCLRFYYYVSATSDQLAIYLVEKAAATNTLTTRLVWQLPTSGAVVNDWTRSYAATSVTSSANQFYLQIEATSTGLQQADIALARLSITFGNCFDIVEEDLIPTTVPTLSYWPYGTSSAIQIFYDSTFTSGPNNSTQQTAITSLLASAITNILPTIYEGTSTSCSLSFSSVTTAPTSFPYIKIIREPNTNAVTCAAMIGPLSTAATEIHVTDSCFTLSNNQTVILHLIAHALGLKHQHRRSDRFAALIVNEYAYDPIYQPFYDIDHTLDTNETIYDLASVTQVGPTFLDQTGGRSPYGTLSSVNNYAFGVATAFSHYDLIRLTNLLGGPFSVCNIKRVTKCAALCFSGGQCSRRPLSSDTGACLCKAGFTGASCTTISCNPPCQNGFCDPGNLCNCASVSSMWTGFRCHIPVQSVCSSIPCENGGTCIVANGQSTCICRPGYTGNTCSTPICEQCVDNVCPSLSTCVSPNRLNCTTGRTGFLCQQCASGFYGNSITGCQPFCSTNCSGNGVCSAPETCSCKPGWTGATCNNCLSGYEYLCYASTTTLSPFCYPPCSPYGGYCSSLGVCSCYNGYEGLTCDRISLTSTTTPAATRTAHTVTMPYSPTTTQLIRCMPKQLIGIDATQLYVRYLLSPYEINYQVLTTNGDVISNERQSLEDFLNRALREELNRYTDNRFMRLTVVNVCPGVVVDVLISYFTTLNATTASRVVIQQARAIGVPLTDGKTSLSRLDFDYIPQSQMSAVNVQLCTVFNDLDACKNGGACIPEANASSFAMASATFSPLMTPVNHTWPTCHCPEGYSGDFCTDAELPLPIWAIVAICVGGIILIALSAVTVHMMCGTGRRQRHRQQRYHRSHPLPPPPGPMPGYLMVPYLQNQPGTLPHPGGRPYNIPVTLPNGAPASIPNEPPPPYDRVAWPTNSIPPGHTATFPRSQIRAEDVDNEFSGLPPPPGYAPSTTIHFNHQQPPFMPQQRGMTTADRNNNRVMTKRPKLVR